MKPYVMWNIDFRDKINIDELNKKINSDTLLNKYKELLQQLPQFSKLLLYDLQLHPTAAAIPSTLYI